MQLQLALVFVAGVSFGYIVSFMNLLTLVDLQGRVRNYSIGFFESNNTEFQQQETDPRRLAEELGVRVACWVLTSKRNNFIEALAVRTTWGKRCDHLVLISSTQNLSLGVIKVDIPDGKPYQWGRTKAGLRYVYKNFLNDTDWFLRAEDYTYVIMENLRSMLVGKNSSELLYLGFHHKPPGEQGYISGGSGYVLSRAALKLVVEKGLDNATLCEASDQGEDDDVLVGQCLYNLGIPPGDSRDSFGRDRFFPVPLIDVTSDWPSYVKFTSGAVLVCCSDSAISFYDSKTYDNLYVYEYLVYILRVHRLRLLS